jgi:prepilin-type N-terminal cleavage/methylation domain-containing protein
VGRSLARASARHSSYVIRHFARAFTLIELLTVIAIIGILAALLAPVLKNFSKPDVTVAATRQMLDDVARARQLAIADRTTVYMVFVPTNFWNDPFKLTPASGWVGLQSLAPAIPTSTITTQLYDAQWNGYMMVALRDVGDQPGRTYPHDLVRVKTLPAGSFIAPFKFTAPLYGTAPANVPYPTNRPDLPIYGFLRTNTVPFPTSDVTTNSAFMTQYNNNNVRFVTVPYIAFNYLGQLTSGDGSVLPYDENIPLAYGSIVEPINPTNKVPTQGLPSAIEIPPGGSTNTPYNVIHIDRLTGRARLERQDLL